MPILVEPGHVVGPLLMLASVVIATLLYRSSGRQSWLAVIGGQLGS